MELDAAFAVSIQHLLSCNRGLSEDQSMNTTAEGERGARSTATPNATVRIKNRNVVSSCTES